MSTILWPQIMERTFILTIKPEKDLTRIGIFYNANAVFLKSVKHNSIELSESNIADEAAVRAYAILDELKTEVQITDIKIIMARGGLLKPIPSGIYEVNEKLEHDLIHSEIGMHPVNLGGLIAADIARQIRDCRAFIVDPVVVDEMNDIARFTGLPMLHRSSIFHALNQKAVARRHARALLKNYEELNLIIAQIGEGISIGAHCKGKVIDVNQDFDGEGPFSLRSAGTLPAGDLVRLCFSEKYTEGQIMEMLRDKGGFFAYVGTKDIYTLQKRLNEGDQQVKQLFEAMAYHISKYIGSLSPVLFGKIDAIILTGNLVSDRWFVNLIIERIKNLAPVYIHAGEDIIEALAQNGLMVLKGEAKILEYN